MQDNLSDEFLDAVYDPALRSGEWRPALCRLRDLLGSAEIAFTVVEHESSQPALWETTGMVLSSRHCENYQSHYMRLDPKLTILAEQGQGFVFNDVDHFDERFVAHDPFYQGYSLPLGTRHTLDLFADSSNGRNVYLAAMRSPAQGPYDAGSENTLKHASAHLVRALKARDQLVQAESVAKVASAALDRFEFGIAVVDREARLSLTNAFARGAFAAAVPLAVERSRVCARAGGNLFAEKLRNAIAGRPSNFRLSGADGWILSIIPLPASSPLASSDDAAVMLLFRPPPRACLPVADDVIALYGLTRAEAEIAIGVAAGKTLKTLALARGVKLSTVRWQMLAVLRKLGVSRQADVVRVLAALSPSGAALRTT